MSVERTVLAVGDDVAIRGQLGLLGGGQGVRLISFDAGQAALEFLRVSRADLALIDATSPQVDGLMLIDAIRRASPACRTILMIASPDLAMTMSAIQMGAHDVLIAPIDAHRIEHLMRDTEDAAGKRRALLAAERSAVEQVTLAGMVGRSAVMASLFSLVRRLSPHARAALISGERGTGRSSLGIALHQLGPRRHAPLVEFDCQTIAPGLIERELFGCARGAFTGMEASSSGILDKARDAAILIEDVGEMPLESQAKLLRVIDDGDVVPAGSLDPHHIDVHVIATTSRDLTNDVETGRFRRDLHERLGAASLVLPPLRERREDIPYLLAAFVSESSRSSGRALVGVTTEAERRLMAAPWPGNITQLRLVVERACALADEEWVTDRDLALPEPEMLHPLLIEPLRGRPFDRSQVHQALDNAHGNKKLAAERLGISRRAFYRLLDSRGLGDAVKRRR